MLGTAIGIVILDAITPTTDMHMYISVTIPKYATCHAHPGRMRWPGG